MLIYRSMYLSQIKSQSITDFKKHLAENSAEFRGWLEQQGIVSFSLFNQGAFLFIYLEASKKAFSFSWETPYSERLEQWPGQAVLRNSIPLLDVFHDGVPEELNEWRGDRTVEQRSGSMVYLKPEQYCSYVFYHYQLQEENPESFNKTYTIGAYENMLFSYSELPESFSLSKPEGKLKTNHTPENWQEVMLPHFQLDQDEDVIWKTLETLFVL
ncbi:hypothetical protein EHS13_27000 [Paenibacillus psychroresistens]|uniref:Uncharacterized protein n=1 Tax=Paenibacillus psychroresistens TaxID=1778678 RepID=A0A6B8RPI2_9BACL|nr:hypothetical protein [Paenibacillus psychroresistens]QGQ98271.1 hypothetical protein EHS13_27000 [Paenibacillus psychroresistens]